MPFLMIFSPSAQARRDRTEPIFTGGDHLGVVTRDLDAAVRTWADHYGVGPWQVFSYDETSMTATYCRRHDRRPCRCSRPCARSTTPSGSS